MNRQQRRRQERELKKMGDQAVTPSGIKVAICVPTHDTVPAYFAYDLAAMIGWTTLIFTKEGAIEDVSLYFVKGTYVHTARQELLANALRGGADYVLFIDSDMRFPKDALVRLLARSEPFVGTNYAHRRIPPDYVAVKTSTRLDEDGERIDGELLRTTLESEGLEEVEALGFGFVLIHTSVFQEMAKIHPPKDKGPFWFFEYHPEVKTHVGEDVYFCRLAREAGATIFVDHDLSKMIRHIGQMEFGLEHTWAFYEDAEKEKADGADHQLHDAVGGGGDGAEQEGPDSSDPGVRPESRIQVVP